ncbi:hypothetical protein [Streptomyces sioyaensis]|uniref:hypothetical protein n=1 Tax=Streptomyces sioyaensis TaxID=67364 RepID=UPI00371C06D7
MKHDFEVSAEADAVTTTLNDAAIRTFEVFYKLPERALGKCLPVPERFLRGFRPEAGSFQLAEVRLAGPRKTINGRESSPPQAADREFAPQG